MAIFELRLNLLQVEYQKELEELQQKFEAAYLFDLADALVKIEYNLTDKQMQSIFNEDIDAELGFDEMAEYRMDKVIALNKVIFEGVKGNGY
jgi:hypothetical protein